MKISVIIPAYNEAERIIETLQSVDAWVGKQHEPVEILVVDDGSRDATRDTVSHFFSSLRSMRQNPSIEVASYTPNRGKGFAVKTGMLRATGDVILFMDADNSTPIEYLDAMLPLFADGYDVVIGTRDPRDAAGAQKKVEQGFIRRMLGGLSNILIRTVTGLPWHDTQCGFKAFTRASAQRIFGSLQTERWLFDVEILGIARRLGYRIGVVPVVWENEAQSRVKPFDFILSIIELFRVKRRIDAVSQTG